MASRSMVIQPSGLALGPPWAFLALHWVFQPPAVPFSHALSQSNIRWAVRHLFERFNPVFGVSSLCWAGHIRWRWFRRAGDAEHQPPHGGRTPVATSVHAGRYVNEWEGLGIRNQHESCQWGKH